jgi:hypothetical protein
MADPLEAEILHALGTSGRLAKRLRALRLRGEALALEVDLVDEAIKSLGEIADIRGIRPILVAKRLRES